MADDSNEDHWLYGDSNLDAEVSQDKNDTNQPQDESNNFVANSPLNEETNDLDNIKEQNGEEQEEIEPIPEQEESRMSIGDEEQEQEQMRIITGSIGLIEPIEIGALVDNTTTPVIAVVENGDDDDDDDSDDDVQVVIGDIKTSTTYSSLNIKRGGLLTSSGTAGNEKLKQPGKFSIEEFEAVGTINGVPAHEYNLDSMEDKPWRKPGADITDYFNYGFNEDTWRAYCERQKRIRVHESGVGLAQLGSSTTTTGTGRGIIPVAITNDNSKYSGFLGPKKAGPPPGRKMAGAIDVIGAGGLASRRGLDKGQTPPKENQVIQVMTADRREYSRKPGFPDMTVPPPLGGGPPQPPPPPPPGFDIPPMGGFADDYHGPDYFPNEDAYYHAYEPTQDSQWDPAWHQTAHPDLKVLTPVSGGGGSGTTTASGMNAVFVPLGTSETSNQDSQGSGRASSREPGDLLIGRTSPTISLSGTADASNSSREHRIKDRHRSHRHRSRSRSGERSSRRRHKSRSRSPSHRSHKKKKSRRSDHEKKEESE